MTGVDKYGDIAESLGCGFGVNYHLEILAILEE